MTKPLEYKGYLGSAEVDVAGDALVGKLLFIRDTITYSATTPKALEAAFHEAVDDYLETCVELGDQPDAPFKGTFNVRIGAGRHREAALLAMAKGVSLNDFVCQAVDLACSSKTEHHTHVDLKFVSIRGSETTLTTRASEPVRWNQGAGRVH